MEDTTKRAATAGAAASAVRGFPDREVWVERLRDYEQQLETELANVKDVIERLAAGDAPEQPGTA